MTASISPRSSLAPPPRVRAVANVLLIVNPGSRGGRRAEHVVGSALRDAGITFEAAETSGPQHATSLVRERVSAHPGAFDLVLALGGDGTAMEVASGLAQLEDAPPLGIVAAGTANIPARSLGIPTNAGRAIAALLDADVASIDIGRVTHGPAFAIGLGIGLDASMIAGTSTQLKRRIGYGAYALSALRAGLRLERFRVRIAVDGRVRQRRPPAGRKFRYRARRHAVLWRGDRPPGRRARCVPLCAALVLRGGPDLLAHVVGRRGSGLPRADHPRTSCSHRDRSTAAHAGRRRAARPHPRRHSCRTQCGARACSTRGTSSPRRASPGGSATGTPTSRPDVNPAVTTITSAGALPVLVAYNIPQRDCGGFSGSNNTSAQGYRDWIVAFANGIGTRRVAVILEPDALAGMDCLSAIDQQARTDLLRFAVQTLAARSSVAVYLDAGNPRWKTAATMSQRLVSAGIDQAQGFSLNVSNFFLTSENTTYGTQLSGLVGGKHFVIDTGRNGLGPTADAAWCNPDGRAIGVRPTTATGNALIDAYLWIKTPGESDGACSGAAAAGTWMPEYALGLAQRS